MSKPEENKPINHPVAQASIVFAVLFVLLLISLFLFDYSNININVIAFILATACLVFISKSVYEISAGPEQIKKMAENMANKLVASSQQLFLEVYNNSPVVYLIIDQSASVVSANTASARLFGQTTNSLIKKDLFSLIETSGDEHKSIIRQKFQEGVVVADEEVKVVCGRNISWTILSIFQFSSSDGRKLSLVTLVDITKQKEVDTAKSEFVSLASHQLRTPISGMRWSAELLLMDGVESLSAQQKRYVDRLLSSIHRMSSLVDDFLQVSRFELGTRVLKQEDVILSELAHEIISDQAEKVAGKRINVVTNFDDSITKVTTDMGLLRMIITNLYVNAVKYTKVGGEIELTYARKGADFMVEVRDNGMGIPVTEQQRVFTKIFRASNAQKEVPDGTGLGLYIVEKAVKELGGRVSFVSAEDVGTTFTVVLPLN